MIRSTFWNTCTDAFSRSASKAVLAATVFSACTTVWAAELPAPAADATTIQQERERQLERLEQRERARDELAAPDEVVSEQEAVPQDVPQVEFVLRSVRFTKSTQLTREELTGIVAPRLGKSVTLKELFAITEEVNALYKSKGIYTSLALLPQQTIKDGVVVVQLVEGKLGDLIVEGNVWSDESWVQGWVQDESSDEAIGNLDMQVLEANILKFNRLHDQQVRAQLRSGATFGTTDIVLTMAEPGRNTFQVWGDNYGFDSAGRYTAGLLGQRQKILFNSDRALIYGTKTKASESFALDYSVGLGFSPVRIGTSVSRTYSEIIEGDFVDAEVRSKSRQFGLYASALVWSSAQAWLEFRAGINRSFSETTLVRVPQNQNEVNTRTLTPTFTWLGNDWRLNTSFTYNFATYDDRLDDDPIRHVEYWNHRMSGTWRMSPTVYLQGNVERQGSVERNMPGSLSFNLGGATSLRGYKAGLISGDRGRFHQMEIHHDGLRHKGHVLDFSAFFDYGKYRAFTEQSLESAGVGLSVYGNSGFSADFTFAKRLNGELEDHNTWQFYSRLAYTW